MIKSPVFGIITLLAVLALLPLLQSVLDTVAQIPPTTQVAAPNTGVDASATDVIPADRQVSWNLAGVVQPDGTKGIPHRTSICMTIDPKYGDETTDATEAIQNAIASCPDNQVVYIGPGTYRLSKNILVNRPVVLRGAGPASTTLKLADTILISPFGTGDGGTLTVANWTGGLEKGSNIITLSDTTGLTVGKEIVLDQTNDPELVFPVGEYGYQIAYRNGTSFYGGIDRAAPQVNKVVAISGNTVTLEIPVYYTHKAELQPQAFWWGRGNMSYAGIEDLKLDGSTANPLNNSPLVRINFCSNCWVKNVEAVNIL